MELRKYFIIAALLIGCQNHSELKKVTYSFHHEMHEKYGLQFTWQSDLSKQPLKKVCFDYCFFGEKSVSDARLLMHTLTNEFLLKINSDSSIEQKFAKFPLGVDDLVISISFITDGKNQNYLERRLSHVTLLDGQIHYAVYDPFQKNFKNVQCEKFYKHID